VSPENSKTPEGDPLVSALREQIDAVDLALLSAVNRRLEIVRALHDHKLERGYSLYDPSREAALIAGLQTANGGPLSDDGVESFFRQLIALSRRELYGEEEAR